MQQTCCRTVASDDSSIFLPVDIFNKAAVNQQVFTDVNRALNDIVHLESRLMATIYRMRSTLRGPASVGGSACRAGSPGHFVAVMGGTAADH